MARKNGNTRTATPAAPPIHHRQGDILLVRVDAVPTGVQAQARRADGRIVLAEGEVTGHSHTVSDERATLLLAEAEAIAGRRWLQIAGTEPVALVHQEHAPILLMPGI